MHPAEVPAGCDHLDEDDRRRLRLCEKLAPHDPEAAHDVLETLWMEAVDAHRRLYQGLANVVAAVVAHNAGQRVGAGEIARRAHEMLAPFPGCAVGIDLDSALAGMDQVLAGTADSLRWERCGMEA